MITQEYLNKEIDLAKRIYLYYFEKMADCMSLGSNKYISWYKDLASLYFICRSMFSLRISDDLIYMGDTVVDDSYVKLMSADIREYINYELVGIDYATLDSDPISPVVPPTPPIFTTVQDWKTVIVSVPSDDVTTVTLPFNVNDTDPDSIMITVNDNNPLHMVAPEEEGCHIIENILYWHEYYNLKQGDRILFQYLEIN